MLELDPNKRISAEEALKHKYFDDIPENVLAIYRKKVLVPVQKWVYKGEKPSSKSGEENEDSVKE